MLVWYLKYNFRPLLLYCSTLRADKIKWRCFLVGDVIYILCLVLVLPSNSKIFHYFIMIFAVKGRESKCFQNNQVEAHSSKNRTNGTVKSSVSRSIHCVWHAGDFSSLYPGDHEMKQWHWKLCYVCIEGLWWLTLRDEPCRANIL